MPETAEGIGPSGGRQEIQVVGVVFVVFLGRHGIPLDGDSAVIFRASMDLLGRRDIQKLTRAEVRGQQAVDLAAELNIFATNLVQIGGSGGGVGQIEGSEKDLFFGHGVVSARGTRDGFTPNA